MQTLLLKYLRAFEKLRIDRAHGIAPHKPILLLSVLQTFQNTQNQTPNIYITPELVAIFKSNWSLLVTTNHDCRFSLPFYHLTSDKFWRLVPKPGFENILRMSSSMRSFANLNAAVDFAVINEDLIALMIDYNSNQILQQFILDKYFPSTKNSVSDSVVGQLQLFDDIENKILNEPALQYSQEIRTLMAQNKEEEIFLRGSLFKREIPKIYNNTCCISGMRIDAIMSVSMVDACHIIPFSISYDDTVSNGLALCPNLHRAFDRGLISIDENYKVIVSKKFQETSTSYSIKFFDQKEIRLPENERYYPLRENIEWQRMNIYNEC